MSELTKNEEDYLKTLFKLIVENTDKKIGNNMLAEYLNVSPASVNSMVKKLKGKGLVNSERYGKLELTNSGESVAVNLVRKHRLWETFLYKYLKFSWDEVHSVAEQLEHVKSVKLINELDSFMDYPKQDPHGAVIPDKDGLYIIPNKICLSEVSLGSTCELLSIKDSSVSLLKYISEIGLALTNAITVLDIKEFDGSMQIEFNGKTETVSKKFCEHVFVSVKK